MTARQIALNLLCKLAAVLVWHRSHGLAVLCFVAPDFYLLYGIFVPWSTILGPIFTRFVPSPAAANQVWLTIDDGPDPEDTPRILDALDRHGARATFFLIGARAERHPRLVAEIVRRGHGVAHHTYSHPAATFWMASRRRVEREIAGGLAVFAALGLRPDLFRPPVGMRTLSLRSALVRHQLRPVAWSIRSGDCLGWSRAALIAGVMRKVKPGAIILLHEGPSARAALRVRLIDELAAQLRSAGYACVIPPPEALRGRESTDASS